MYADATQCTPRVAESGGESGHDAVLRLRTYSRLSEVSRKTQEMD